MSTRCATIIFASASSILSASAARAAPPPALVIVVDDERQVAIRPVDAHRVDLGAGRRGLVIWEDGDRERWQFFTGQWTRPRGTSTNIGDFDLDGQSRGADSPAASSLELLQSTTLLAELRIPAVNRGAGDIVTPFEGSVLLDPRVTFRREPPDGESRLPPADATLRQGGQEVLRIRFPESANQVEWTDKDHASGGRGHRRSARDRFTSGRRLGLGSR